MKRTLLVLCALSLSALIFSTQSFSWPSGKPGATSLSSAQPPNMQQNRGCTRGTLEGRYGYAISGQAVNAAAGPVGPFALSGYFIFDGAGKVTGGKDTVSYNGAIVDRTVAAGSYTVDSNCSGVLTLQIIENGGVSPPRHLQFVIVDDGKELVFMQRDPYVVMAGSAKR